MVRENSIETDIKRKQSGGLYRCLSSGGGGGVAYDFSMHDIVYFLLIFRIAMLTSRKSSCFDCTHCAFRFTRVKQAFMQGR